MAQLARSAQARRTTRIQRANVNRILEAALEVFSANGFRGSTLDQIATRAGISKPNLLYYFANKESIHRELLDRLLAAWLEPLRQLDPDGDPVDEITGYVHRKLEMARDYPRESRLFANEIMHGAPIIEGFLCGELKDLVDRKAETIGRWVAEGRIAPVNPHHLIFSIWATTQHYADFSAQINLVLGRSESTFDDAETFLDCLFRRALSPDTAR